MIVTWVLGASILLLGISAGLSLRLIRVTGRWPAWTAIAVAAVLMASERGLALMRLLSGEATSTRDTGPLWITLGISLLLVAALASVVTGSRSLRRSADALRSSEQQFRRLFERSPVGYQSLDVGGYLIEVNSAWLKMLGYSRDQVIGRWFGDFIASGCADRFEERFTRLKVEGEVHGVEYELVRADGSAILCELDGRISYDAQGNVECTHCVVRDVTASKRVGRAKAETLELLQLINAADTTENLLRRLTHYFRRLAGCEAVGVRLRDRYDFTYYETSGFPEGFVLQENGLCARDEAGDLIRDSDGDAVLECICGDVIRGRFDPAIPFFTEHGTFWTNSTTDYLASHDEVDRQARPRNRCNGEGYESVALLPLRVGSETVGLLQLNDRRRGFFTQEGIDRLEQLAGYVAVAVSRRLAADAARGAEQRYRTLASHLPGGAVHLFDRDLRLVVAAGGVSPSLSLTGEDVEGRQLHEALSPDVYILIEPHYRAALAGDEQDLEVLVDERWFDLRSVPIRDDSGAVVAGMVVWLDLTKRKRAEVALRQSEARYRALADNAPLGVYRTTPDGRIEYANPALVEMLGYSSLAELASRNLENEGFEPQYDRQRFKARLMREGSITGLEASWRRRDGSLIYVRENARVTRDADGTPVYYDGIVEDVTAWKEAEQALRESEARFRQVAENVPDVFWLVSPDYTEVAYISPGYENVWGQSCQSLYDKPETWLEAVHPQDRARVARDIEARARGEASDTEYRIQRPDGTTRWIRDQGFPVLDGDGKVCRAAGIARDITERVRVQEELAQYRDHLEELVRQRTRELERSQEELRRSERLASLGTFAAGLAHEINNPIGSILLAADNARRFGDGPQSQQIIERALTKIVANATRCGHIVKSVLQFARDEASDKLPGDLCSVLRNAIDATREYADQRGASVEFVAEDALPDVNMAPVVIEQAFVNLIRNAVESREAGARVTLQVERRPGVVRVSVADDGRGLTPDQKSRLFDPFFTTRRQSGGTGLGMSISHGIIAEHGGTIDIDSRRRQGTVIIVELPLHSTPEQQVTHAESTGR